MPGHAKLQRERSAVSAITYNYYTLMNDHAHCHPSVKLQTPHSKLQASNSKLRALNSKLQASNSKLRASNSKRQASNSKHEAVPFSASVREAARAERVRKRGGAPQLSACALTPAAQLVRVRVRLGIDKISTKGMKSKIGGITLSVTQSAFASTSDRPLCFPRACVGLIGPRPSDYPHALSACYYFLPAVFLLALGLWSSLPARQLSLDTSYSFLIFSVFFLFFFFFKY